MAAVRVNASSPAWWHGWSRHGAVARPRSGSHRAPRFQAVGVYRTADRVPSLIPPLRSVKRRDATRVSDHGITRRLKEHDPALHGTSNSGLSTMRLQTMRDNSRGL